MRKLVLMAVAMALVTVLPAGAQAKTKTKTISTGIYLDVSGYIDRHGGVFYFWGGDLDAKRSACRDGRTVTLFRVEPNGTATPVGSNTSLGDTPDVLNSSFGDLLERPLDAITGYYYAEVAPKRVKTTNQKEPEERRNGGRTIQASKESDAELPRRPLSNHLCAGSRWPLDISVRQWKRARALLSMQSSSPRRPVLTLFSLLTRPASLPSLRKRETPPQRGFLRCRRRDSNPRHADYDSAALTD